MAKKQRDAPYYLEMMATPELSICWVDPRVGLGWVVLDWVGNGSKIIVFSGLGWVMGLK